jgi:hypothetical protein
MLYLVITIVSLIAIAYIIGSLLPKDRIEWREVKFSSSPKMVYEVVTNNGDFSYRTDLSDLQIIENNGEFQTWKEISKKGQSITFRSTKKEPYSRYEFEIVEASGFKGYCVGEFAKTDANGTNFISTEHVVVENPFIRLLSYLFFDLGEYMESYQKDLASKLNEEYHRQ